MQKRLAYKYRINPDADASVVMRKMALADRFVWNWAVAQHKNWYRAANEVYSHAMIKAKECLKFHEDHYGKLEPVVKKALLEDYLNDYVDTSLKPNRFQVQRQIKDLKKQYPWLSEESIICSLQVKLRDLEQAYQKFFKNPKDGEPRFKKRDDDHLSFTLVGNYASTFLRKVGKKWYVKLPKLKELVPIVLHRELRGEPKEVTISFNGFNWFVSISTIEHIDEPIMSIKPAVGIDVGVAHAVVTSDGKMYEPHKALKRSSKRLKKLNQKLARAKSGSKRRDRVKRNLKKKYLKVVNQRKHHIHNITSDLTKSHGIIVMEDLKLENMTKSAKGDVDNPGRNVKAKSGLNRVLLDASLFEYKRQLAYKCLYGGVEFILVDPKHTSQACHHCGHVSKGNRKSQSKFECEVCGHIDNADINAAKNILKRGLASRKEAA